MTDKWEITSAVADIFDPPPENPLTHFFNTVDTAMNGYPFLLKGHTNKPISENDRVTPFLYVFFYNYFNELFFEFDRKTGHYDFHDWYDTPESEVDFFAGYKPCLEPLIKTDMTLKPKPMSYLGFTERLYWMLRTSPNYHHVERVNHETAITMIHDMSKVLFGKASWTIGDSIEKPLDLPNWIAHPWTFCDIAPDFLNTTGYFGLSEDELTTAYFDGGASDSATFFFRDTTFYLLLTCGSP